MVARSTLQVARSGRLAVAHSSRLAVVRSTLEVGSSRLAVAAEGLVACNRSIEGCSALPLGIMMINIAVVVVTLVVTVLGAAIAGAVGPAVRRAVGRGARPLAVRGNELGARERCIDATRKVVADLELSAVHPCEGDDAAIERVAHARVARVRRPVGRR